MYSFEQAAEDLRLIVEMDKAIKGLKTNVLYVEGAMIYPHDSAKKILASEIKRQREDVIVRFRQNAHLL